MEILYSWWTESLSTPKRETSVPYPIPTSKKRPFYKQKKYLKIMFLSFLEHHLKLVTNLITSNLWPTFSYMFTLSYNLGCSNFECIRK